jgi:hypothetical protein
MGRQGHGRSDFDAIYCSDLKRARETAEIIVKTESPCPRVCPHFARVYSGEIPINPFLMHFFSTINSSRTELSRWGKFPGYERSRPVCQPV